MENKYPVASIDRHRIGIDGHGIRTLIVMQECPLRCKYCLNPFTWNGNRKATYMTARELFEEVNIDRLYMLATAGGITFGGGEPLLHPDLFEEMRTLCDSKISFIVETSLNVPWYNVEKVISSVDEYIVDIKTTDDAKYKAYTSGYIGVTLSNLQELVSRVGPSKVVVRIPIIPEFTNESDQRVSKFYLQTTMGIQRFDLFEYRVVEGKSNEINSNDHESIVMGRSMTFDELEFSVRTYNSLYRSGIKSIEELKKCDPKEIANIKNLGRKSKIEILTKMEEWGLLKTNDEDM